MPVDNNDRIAAALLRLEQAERLVSEARKIFTYAEKQTDNRRTDTSQRADRAAPGVDGLYPGQLPDPEALIKYEDEEDNVECLE
jgi:hypothetical protein